MFLSGAVQAELLAAVDLPSGFMAEVEALWAPLADRVLERQRAAGGMLVVGLNGPQGSGKSTGARALEVLLRAGGLNAAVLSIDDLYLSHAGRRALAARAHPLFITRGPPGTHDVALGMRVVDALARAGAVPLPRFVKATDNPAAKSEWPLIDGPVDVLIFEGWCVGARAEPSARLATAVNALERDEDPAGVWRRYSNDALAGEYQALFDRIGLLVQLRAPSFDAVLGWRLEQERRSEHRLMARIGERGAGRGMNEAQIARFIQHYERLTRWIDEEMPGRADVVVQLDQARRPESITGL